MGGEKQRRGRGSRPWARSLQPPARCSRRGRPEASPRDGAMWLPWALLLLCVPGSLSLSGPNNVTGTVGGSLSVQCRYKKEYEAFNKYWCRQPCLPLFSETVMTCASRGEVERGRVSILDHPGNLTFTVTLKNLTANDAGKYRCGISTLLLEEGLPGFLPEPFFQVQVFVSPASSSKSSARTPGPPSRDPGSLFSSVHFLLLIFLKVPLFLSMLSAILWVNRPQRATCEETQFGEDNLPLSPPINVLSRVTATQLEKTEPHP